MLTFLPYIHYLLADRETGFTGFIVYLVAVQPFNPYLKPHIPIKLGLSREPGERRQTFVPIPWASYRS